MDWHLAQLNVARLRAPLDDPATAEFVDALDEINALADRSAGFLWRLQTEDGNATSVRASDDELFIVNMSTWTSMQALGDADGPTPEAFTFRRPFPPSDPAAVELAADERDACPA